MRKLAPRVLPLGLFLCLFSLWGSAWAQQSSSQQNPTQQTPAKSNPGKPSSEHSEKQSEPSTTFTADVKLVTVFVTVTDAKGSPIGGLTKDNFLIEEDGQEQKIA